jgi:2-keto-4-pentenoate hydratase/2-oxohepta-3-ene-1,7-dioic acid hydratase in catechol pathway
MGGAVGKMAQAPRLGLIDAAGMIRDVTGVTGGLPDLRWPVPPGDHLIANLSRLRGPIEAIARRAPAYVREEVAVLSPVANPGKIVCTTALDRPELTGKVASTIAGESDGFRLRGTARATLHEPALGIVIGRPGADLAEAEALDHVAGYCCVLDSSPDSANAEPGSRVSLDTCVTLGPWLVTADEIADPAGLEYRLWVGEALRASGRILAGPFGIARLVAFASSVMPLHPGDLLMAGPGGSVSAEAGDVVALDIGGLGRLDVAVRASPAA